MSYLDDRIKDSKVLFIPVYSMREYTTGKYKLLNDGNMNRVISKVFSAKPKKATILIPEVSNIADFEELKKFISNCGLSQVISFVESSGYKENANATRKTITEFLSTYNELKNKIKLDLIVSEPNFLTSVMALTNGYCEEIIYWCVASKTSTYSPWFVEEFAALDKVIAENINTAVLTKTQVEYLQGKSFVDSNFYCPELFDYKTIFFPFRLSDKSYKAEVLKDIIYNIRAKGYNNFKVLYSDPNESGVFEEDEVFKKVSSDKDVYLSILKSKPIIPYFEDSNNVLHISIFEFDFYKCKVIMYENDNIDFETAIKIKDDSEIEQAIINLLEEEVKC